MSYYRRLSGRQRLWLAGTIIAMLVILTLGWALEPKGDEVTAASFSAEQTIRQVAPKVGATGFAIAKELHLDQGQIDFYALRRRDVSYQPLLKSVEYHFPKRPFSE